jgi:hypothetical protein
MASSAPASSEALVNRSAPAPDAGAERPARAPIGGQYPSGLVRALTIPAAFIAANWAALLAILTVIGTVPALIAATRTTTDLHAHADRAFRETLRAAFVLLRRDWLMSLVLWVLLALLVGNSLILADLATGSTRVFLVGLALPPTWLAVSFLSAYVLVASEMELTAPRGEVAGAALRLMVRRPLRALLAPLAVIAVSPLWMLAPLTIAIGFSLPPFLVAKVWGR